METEPSKGRAKVMRVVPELVKAVKENTLAGKGAAGQAGTIRVDITQQVQKTFEAVYKTEDKTFQFLIDEPAVRGGQSQGPTPLGFFVAGAGG
jgi:hypothetical protein